MHSNMYNAIYELNYEAMYMCYMYVHECYIRCSPMQHVLFLLRGAFAGKFARNVSRANLSATGASPPRRVYYHFNEIVQYTMRAGRRDDACAVSRVGTPNSTTRRCCRSSLPSDATSVATAQLCCTSRVAQQLATGTRRLKSALINRAQSVTRSSTC